MPIIHTYVKVSSTCAKLRPAISQDKSNPTLGERHFKILNLEPPAIPLLLSQCSGHALHFNYLPPPSPSHLDPTCCRCMQMLLYTPRAFIRMLEARSSHSFSPLLTKISKKNRSNICLPARPPSIPSSPPLSAAVPQV
jgi:hypothetical protein